MCRSLDKVTHSIDNTPNTTGTGRFDRLGNNNAVSTEYGRRARVTAGDLKQIMQAQADAFFGMSSQIAALHEHVEMLKDCRSRNMLKNEPFLATIGVDTI